MSLISLEMTQGILKKDLIQIRVGVCTMVWEILSHPKILECEINKIGTMFACLDLKFHRE
jgi:hypothetical protein